MRHVDRIVVVALFALTLSVAAPALLADGGKDMTAAAVKLLASLDDEQRKVAHMSYDDPKRTDWHYIPKKTRKGLTLREMKPEQRELAMHLLRQALSPEAFRKAKRAIELEAVLQAVEKSPRRDPQKYYTTIFGTPSNDGTWGYSFEGHHLSLNWVVKDGKLVCATPLFYGANPGVVLKEPTAGLNIGTRPLAVEEQLGFDLLKSLTPQQHKVAYIGEKPQKRRRRSSRSTNTRVCPRRN